VRPLDVTMPTRLATRLAGEAARKVADDLATADPVPIPDPKPPERFKPGTRIERPIPRPRRWSTR